jgi:hypothetical protein
MRIAILCDIHGNLPAFETALDHAANLAPDLLIIAGDMVCGCPDSDLCWQRALDLDCLLYAATKSATSTNWPATKLRHFGKRNNLPPCNGPSTNSASKRVVAY